MPATSDIQQALEAMKSKSTGATPTTGGAISETPMPTQDEKQSWFGRYWEKLEKPMQFGLGIAQDTIQKTKEDYGAFKGGDTGLRWGRLASGLDIKDMIESGKEGLEKELTGKKVLEQESDYWRNLGKEELPEDANAMQKFKNFSTRLSKGTVEFGLEMLSDPLNWIPTGAIGTGAKQVGKGGLKLAGTLSKAESIAPYIKRASELKKNPAIRFVSRMIAYRYGEPEDYIKMAEKAQRGKALAGEKGVLFGKQLKEDMKGLSKAERIRVGQIIKGGVSTRDDLMKIATPSIDEFESLGKQAVGLGLLDEKTFSNGRRAYMPRLYELFENPVAAKDTLIGTKKGADSFIMSLPEKVRKSLPTSSSKSFKIGGSRFMKKKNDYELGLSYLKSQGLKKKTLDNFADSDVRKTGQAMRKGMGEILDPVYPVAKGIEQLNSDVAIANYFKEAEKLASDLPQDGYKRILNAKDKYGDLAGKYVPDYVYDDMNRLGAIESNNDMWKTIKRGYNKSLGAWKYGKVILNPATHFRNMVSNLILADMGGLSPVRVDRYGEAIKELAKKGKYFKEAKANSDFLTETFAHKEMGDFLNAFEKGGDNVYSKLKAGMGRLVNKPAALYEIEEKIPKMAMYIHKRKAGLSAAEAAKEAEKWLFNYNKIPPIVDKLRQFPIGYPFLTFTWKAVPRTLESAITNPKKLAKYRKIIRGVEEESDASETAEERSVFDTKMKEGSWMKLPYKDKYGQSQYLDLTYILPWNDLSDMSRTISPNNPAYSLLGDLLNNHSGYTGQAIFDDNDTDKEKRDKVFDYALKALMPSLMPGKENSMFEGGYSYTKLKKAFLKKEDYYGKLTSPKSAVGSSLFGIKTKAIDTDKERKRREREINTDIEKYKLEAYIAGEHKGYSEEEKERKIKNAEEKLIKLRKQLEEIGGQEFQSIRIESKDAPVYQYATETPTSTEDTTEAVSEEDRKKKLDEIASKFK